MWKKTLKKKLHKLLVPWIEFLIMLFFRNNLEKYLHLLKFGRDRAKFSRILQVLAFLPPARNSELTIKSGTFLPNFKYYSSKKDDLQFSSRLDFYDWEIISLNFFYLWAKNCRNIADIGSYSGVYAVLGALACPTANVLAFEPNSDSRLMVSRNVELNGLESRISIEEVGLGATSGEFKLYKHDSNSLNSGASLLESSEIFEEITVRTLDTYLPNSLIDLLKIDVEGFESQVLQGGRSLISQNSPVIICEALSPLDLGKQGEVLQDYGYVAPIRVSEVGPDSRNFIWCTPSDLTKVLNILDMARLKCFK